MKYCLNKKCNKELESTNPKASYCSTKCRVYAARANKRHLDTEELEYVVTKSGGRFHLDKKLSNDIKEILGLSEQKVKTPQKKYDALPIKTNNDEFRFLESKPKGKSYDEYMSVISNYLSDECTPQEDYSLLRIDINKQSHLADWQKKKLINEFTN